MFKEIIDDQDAKFLEAPEKAQNEYNKMIKQTFETYMKKKIDSMAISTNPQLIRGFMPDNEDP